MNDSKLLKIYEKAIEQWRINKGVGSILLHPPLNTHEVVIKVLQRLYEKNESAKVLIVVKNFNERSEIVYSLTHGGDKDNDEEFRHLIDNKQLKIYTHDFITTWNYGDLFDLVVVLKLNNYTDNVKKVFNLTKFKLMILTSQIEDTAKRAALYKECPSINVISDNDLSAISLNSPVEETRIAVDLVDKEDIDNLKKYDEFISQTNSIFGSFDMMNKARVGDPTLNISAASIREDIARENGWSRDLDTSVDIYAQIDAMYNPVALLERSEVTFDIIRKRTNILANNKAKLEKILSLCLEHSDKKILIVSKNSSFATEITNYLNSHIPNVGKTEIEGTIFDTDKPVLRTYPIAGSYHLDIEKVPAYDKYGNPKYIQTGIDTGKPKMMGAQAQKTENARLFNDGYIKVLSANNAVDKALNCIIDLMIITSPFCDTIKELKFRLRGVQFSSTPNKIIKLYMKSTSEEKQLIKEVPTAYHTIVNNCEINSSYDENLGAIVVN